MKLPRNLSGDDLIKALARLGYTLTRQRGSHVRLTTIQNGKHDVTVRETIPFASARFPQFCGTLPPISESRATN
jgi:predicted RNA binding protein YcfA (HicA-like mRNA interferase family)